MSCGVVTRSDVVQRLPHHFQNIALKFRQFIQEEHTVMPQRNFARTWHRTATAWAGLRDLSLRRRNYRLEENLETFSIYSHMILSIICPGGIRIRRRFTLRHPARIVRVELSNTFLA